APRSAEVGLAVGPARRGRVQIRLAIGQTGQPQPRVLGPLRERHRRQKDKHRARAKRPDRRFHAVIMSGEVRMSRYDARMKSRLTAALAAGFAVLTTLPGAAHHSFATEYDATRPITVTGEVVRLEWTNPHARVVVSGKDEKGVSKDWDF